MRFTHYVREPYIVPRSKRRVAMAEKGALKESRRFPLFPELSLQETPAERMDRADESRRAWLKAMRRHEAMMWRRGRRALFALPPERRRDVLATWNAHRWLPGDAASFCDFLHGQEVTLERGD